MTQKNKKSLTAPVSSNPEIACPKTYELRLPTYLIRIPSFQDGYLMGGGFVGSSVRDPGLELPKIHCYET